MNILAQYGILKYYSTKSNRQWDTTHNKYIPIVFLDMGDYSPFQLIMESGTNAEMRIYNANTEEEVTTSAISLVVSDKDTYVRVHSNGGNLAYISLSDDYFYAVITGDSGTCYSDVFGWMNDVDVNDLIKVSASSSNIAMGRKSEYVLDISSSTFTCYFNVNEYLGIIPETEEDANENNGVVIPYYVGTAKSRAWIIDGNEYIYEFLLSLRILNVNGEVTITYRGVVYLAEDIIAEKEEEYGDSDIIDINLSIKANGDIMTVINSIRE